MKKIEFLFKNLLLFFLLKIKRLPEPANRNTFDENSKLLFIRLNRIGDALISTPFLHYLKSELKCSFYILADPKNFFVFKNNPDIDDVVIFNKGIIGFRKFFNLLKNEKINTIIDMHDDVSATVSFLIALSGVKIRFGLEKKNKKIFTQTVPRPDPVKVHVVDRILQLSKLFNLNPEKAELKIRYYPGKEADENAGRFISENFTCGKSLLGINISAGGDARFWGTERYKELINYLSSYDIEILILGAPADKDKIMSIAYPKYFISVSFDEFASVISKVNILFSPDTAAIHLASAFNIPVFGLYVHDTDDMIWSPVNVDFDYIETKEHNLHTVQFKDVLKKFKPFLEKHIK